MESCSTIFLEWVSIHCFQVELEFKVLVFVEVGKPENRPGEKPSEQGQEQTTHSTYIWRQLWDPNPGHRGGRRALSQLHHPCSPI